MEIWGNQVFSYVWDNFTSAYNKGAAVVSDFAKTTTEPIVKSVQWIWEALQGDFNDNRTAGQIAADAALGVIPFIDQVLDVRDLIANCRNINKDSNNKAAWIALGLTLVGFIPSLGSIAKGVFKIILLTARKYGGDIARALEPAMEAIIRFVANNKVKRVLGISSVNQALTETIKKLRSSKASININRLLSLMNQKMSDLVSIINKVKYVAPAGVVAWLDESLRIIQHVRQQADRMLAPALAPIQKAIDDIIAYLERKIGYQATTNVRTPHRGSAVSGVDPKLISRAKKGLYGEIISDEYMRRKGHKQLLPEGRYARSLEDVPKGRGMDGVYLNANPPPKYIITETKYRQTNGADKNKYIDSDGSASDTALATNRGGIRQMSSTWIDGHINKEFKNNPTLLAELRKKDAYLSLLMIVDESGKVIAISKLDKNGKTVAGIRP